MATLLRNEWDAIEADSGGSLGAIPPYRSEEESLAQLQRILQFAQTRNEGDLRRIERYGQRQMETVRRRGMTASGPWISSYMRLENIILSVIERHAAAKRTDWTAYTPSIELLRFLVDQIPAKTSKHGQGFYRALALAVSVTFFSLDEQSLKQVVDIVLAPLKHVTPHTLNAYEAFGCIFLPLPFLSAEPTPVSQRFLELLAYSINYKLLASSLAALFKASGLSVYPNLTEPAGQLRLLGCFIYFHRYAHNFSSPESYSAQKDFVTVVSMLLNSLPNGIVDGPNTDTDSSENVSSAQPILPVNEFLQAQILSLVNQESVGGLLSGSALSESKASEDEKVEEARQLANYALALLRFFPRRGDEIRLWLYLGPTNAISTRSGNMPAIRYFWEAAKRSSIFTTIFRDSRAAIALLKPKTGVPNANRISWQPPSSTAQESTLLEDEWRVILVFLELYTFVLKVMDDEEFFSGGGMSSTATSVSTMTRDNALPLSEVKDLTTFLKNLGFTLYFNASEISSAYEPESASTGLSFFNSRKSPEPEPEKRTEVPAVAVAGLSLDYVKGLVTGLLRMVYERDSRRKFLPANHWLMTSRFDMTGFIPTVVQEEESRHKIEEEDAEDDQDDVEEIEDTPQLIGTGRVQQQRRLERLHRQQRKASRRRFLEAAAPRLEILQNMPFFIPFTTRVQIFREFVNLDMVSCLPV